MGQILKSHPQRYFHGDRFCGMLQYPLHLMSFLLSWTICQAVSFNNAYSALVHDIPGLTATPTLFAGAIHIFYAAQSFETPSLLLQAALTQISSPSEVLHIGSGLLLLCAAAL